MYEKINQGTANVLQNINSNKIPLIIVITILVVFILVMLIYDYVTFSKSEGFDIPDINTSNPTQNYDEYKNILPGNSGGGGNGDGNSGGNSGGIDDGRINDIIGSRSGDNIGIIGGNIDINSKINEINTVNNNIKEVGRNFNTVKNFNARNEFNKMFDMNNYSFTSSRNGKKVNTINKNPSISRDNPIANTFIILSFIIVILILCMLFLPGLRELKTLFSQISNVTYVILYTIFLILFLRLMPTNIMDSNAYYIVPITMILAFIIFLISFRSKYMENFNINYERIKIIILYFCFITICITYYAINPGQYITKYFSISLLLSALIGIFGFVYLIILLTLPGVSENLTSTEKVNNILGNISSFSKYGTILFAIFLIVVTCLIATFPGGFFKNNKSILLTPLIVIASILWSILLISNAYSAGNGINSLNKLPSLLDSNFTLIKKTLLVLFGLTISGILIAYIIYNIQSLSNKSNIPSFILSIILIISILILIYKTIFVKIPSPQLNNKKNSFFELLINIVFYIPCIFAGLFDTIMKFFISEYKSNSLSTYLILLIVIILIILYFIVVPKIQSSFNKQGGKQIIENEKNINNLSILSSYQELNDTDAFDYQYGISFWVFIESSPPNTNSNYNKFTSILNYGGKPNVLYKADDNTLIITMQPGNQGKTSNQKDNNKLIDYDDNGNQIIYKNTNFLLQKWNNIIINYNGGTLDIFLNGELVKSSREIIPYMQYDNLTIGSQDGINGGICNLVYFKKPLTLINVYYIYNNLKNQNPPVVN